MPIVRGNHDHDVRPEHPCGLHLLRRDDGASQVHELYSVPAWDIFVDCVREVDRHCMPCLRLACRVVWHQRGELQLHQGLLQAQRGLHGVFEPGHVRPVAQPDLSEPKRVHVVRRGEPPDVRVLHRFWYDGQAHVRSRQRAELRLRETAGEQHQQHGVPGVSAWIREADRPDQVLHGVHHGLLCKQQRHGQLSGVHEQALQLGVWGLGHDGLDERVPLGVRQRLLPGHWWGVRGLPRRDVQAAAKQRELLRQLHECAGQCVLRAVAGQRGQRGVPVVGPVQVWSWFARG